MGISPVPARVQSNNGVGGLVITHDRGRERAPATPSLSHSLPAPSTHASATPHASTIVATPHTRLCWMSRDGDSRGVEG
jgi:hypothetical protein